MIQLPDIFSTTRRWLFIRLIVNGIMQAATIIGSMLLVRYAFDVMLNPEFDDPEVHMFELSQVWEIALFALGLLGCTGLAAWAASNCRCSYTRWRARTSWQPTSARMASSVSRTALLI